MAVDLGSMDDAELEAELARRRAIREARERGGTNEPITRESRTGQNEPASSAGSISGESGLHARPTSGEMGGSTPALATKKGKLVHPKVFWSGLSSDRREALLKSVGVETEGSMGALIREKYASHGFDKMPLSYRIAIAEKTKGERGAALTQTATKSITPAAPRVSGRQGRISGRVGGISPRTPRLR